MPDDTPRSTEPLRRFYETARAGPADNGLSTVLLDGRPLRTPARALLAAPTPLAEAMAAEWNAQAEIIEPTTMPLTRLVNTAIDGVAGAIEPVKDDIAAIAGNDLVIYRADWPEGLAERQRAAWDPVIADAQARFGVRLVLTEGVMPVRQDERLAPAVRAALPNTPLPLAALHQLTTLTGSAFMALAVRAGALAFEDAWRAAHVDEDWNIMEWGEDAQAAERRAARKRDAEAAATILRHA
jgi:chaperone required for assembly of F1-ATPase